MKKREDIACRELLLEASVLDFKLDKVVEYHPLSYYISGGSDPTGKRLQDTNDIGFDSDDPMDFGVAVDPLCDPRTTMFDIIEELGAQGVNKVDEYISNRKNKPESNN